VAELLIVDDEEALRRWAEGILGDRGYTCDSAGDASTARERLQIADYQLVLLNVSMPGESGIQLLSDVRSTHPACAVVMVTAEDSTSLAMTAIEHGAYGYIIKPVAAGELLINVANALHRRRRDLESSRMLQGLQTTVAESGVQLEEALQDLRLSETKVVASQAETIFRLARLVEFRDEETGHHVQRMSAYCEILARRIGLSEQRCGLIGLASQLHDVGKVAIPDSILLKRGKLTPEEFEIIKGHVETGYRMLAGSASEVVQLGAIITRSHHERWDGSGYPAGMVGEAIPQEGRIAAVADVYDALTSDRVYRSAFPVNTAIEIMQSDRGSHFEPALLDAFMISLPEVEAIRNAYTD
jgi:putative two-component system response regulator